MYPGAKTPNGRMQEGIRCRYCVEERSFLKMNLGPDGGFICGRCGHMERPNDSTFPCACRKCVRAFLFTHDHRPRIRVAGQHVPAE